MVRNFIFDFSQDGGRGTASTFETSYTGEAGPPAWLDRVDPAAPKIHTKVKYKFSLQTIEQIENQPDQLVYNRSSNVNVQNNNVIVNLGTVLFWPPFWLISILAPIGQ